MTNQLTPVQSGWLKLADIKTSLFKELQALEFAVQAHLIEMDHMPLVTLQDSIKSAKLVYNDAKVKRMDFTKMLDEKLINPSMEFEKRMDQLIKSASSRELELRKVEAEKVSRENEYLQEFAKFKAHITNEWFRIAYEYRINLEKGIQSSYRNCIECKVPVEQISMMMDDCARIISLFKLPEFNKFERKLITDGQAKEIYDSIDKYDPSNDLKHAINTIIPHVWETYAYDLQNAESAIKEMESIASKKIEAMESEMKTEIAINSLVAEAEQVIIEGPKVKHQISIVPEETEEWAVLIMTSFIKRLNHVNKFIRVKSWQKLSIGQMADALAKYMTETGEIIDGIQIEKVCK